MKSKEMRDYKKILKISIILLVILGIVSLILGNYKDYTEVRLRKNNKMIFSIADLKVDDLKYGDMENDIKKKIGKPKKEKKIKKDIYEYKKLHYNGMTLTLRENYDDFMLVKAEVTGKKYNVSRDIKVGNNVKKVMNKYNVETEVGTYIYGNYSIDALDESEITENIYQGIRDKKNIIYINRDAKIDGEKVNVAKLVINYKKGRVNKITWSYDFQ